MPPAQPKADFLQDPAPVPEIALLAAVVHQALSDLGGPDRRDASEAWAFLTAPRGAWARARAEICGALGLDPDSVRDAVIRRFRDPSERERGATRDPSLKGASRALIEPVVRGKQGRTGMARYGGPRSRRPAPD